MDQVKLFREYTRELECHLAYLNQSDCCQCGINESQCFLIVEIGREPGICVKELAEKVGLDKSGISRGVEEPRGRGAGPEGICEPGAIHGRPPQCCAYPYRSRTGQV